MSRRVPKHFDGIHRTGLKIDEILPELMKEISRKMADPREAVYQEWDALLGKQMAPLARPISFLEGILTIKVKSSTLYSLLTLHEKPRLLRGLKEKFQVRDLVFRIG